MNNDVISANVFHSVVTHTSQSVDSFFHFIVNSSKIYFTKMILNFQKLTSQTRTLQYMGHQKQFY